MTAMYSEHADRKMNKLKVASTDNGCTHIVIQSSSASGHNPIQEWAWATLYIQTVHIHVPTESPYTQEMRLASWLALRAL